MLGKNIKIKHVCLILTCIMFVTSSWMSIIDNVRGRLSQKDSLFNIRNQGNCLYLMQTNFDDCILRNDCDNLTDYQYSYLQKPFLKNNLQTGKYINDFEEVLDSKVSGYKYSRDGSETAGNHDPILIIGNDDFTSENGVTGGNGTTEDPYIIENWVIIGNGSTEAGIYVGSTTAAFVVRNCSISEFDDEFFKGIYFYNVTEGKIKDVEAFNNYYGIFIEQSSFISVENCVCHDNYGVYATGIKVFCSHHIIITDCECYRMRCSLTQIAACGIVLGNSAYCQIRNSTCHLNKRYGIYLYLSRDTEHPLQYNVIENCTIYKNECGGIEVFMSFGLTWKEAKDVRHGYNHISNCVVYDNGHLNAPVMNSGPGISLYEIDDSIVENCILYENGVGVEITNSCNNHISNCTMYNHWQPMFAGVGVRIRDGGDPFWEVTHNNTVEHCDIFDQHVGISIFSGFQTTIRNNNIYNQTLYGIDVYRVFSPSMGVIHGNNIYNNTDGNNFYGWSFFDARDNWWGSSLGPSRSPGHFRGDVIWTRLGIAVCLRFPWATKPFVDAGVIYRE